MAQKPEPVSSSDTIAKANARRAAAAFSKGDLKFTPDTSADYGGRAAAAKSLTSLAETQKVTNLLAKNTAVQFGINSGRKTPAMQLSNHNRNAVSQSVPTRRSGKKG